MIVDSSALIAILSGEPERPSFLRAIIRSSQRAIAAPTLVESTIVLTKFSAALEADLRALLRDARIDVMPFDQAQAQAAQEAYRRFGRRSSSKARLNFGDCLAYAASIVSGRPLLYKGTDFTHTDVIRALTK